MAIDCNDIHTVAAELKERFVPCYRLTADDLDTVVELIQAVELCVSAGTGFMTKSVYDINDNGIVDNAELVNGLTVETAVPPGALFTDTITDISGKEDHLGLPSINGQVLSSTTAGVRSWVNTVAGGGDMTTAIYDTNANNIVDNSELVNGLTVETAVPSGAIFTDTVYDDTAVYAAIAAKEDALGNPASNGYVLSSATNGLRSWVEIPSGIVNLSFTASPTNGVVTSSAGTDATITLATITNAGLLAPADQVLLNNTSGINTGDSPTNLIYTASSVNGTVESSDGTNATIPAADVINAGLMLPAEKVLLGNQSGVNTGDNAVNTNYANDYRAANFVAGTDYEPAKGADDNFVTDAEKVVIGNTSGTNTGDQDLSALVSKPTESTGTALVLSDPIGRPYNMGAANGGTTYTTSGLTAMGWAVCRINASSEPTVTGGTKIAGATFAASTDMHMVVQTLDGIVVQYYFIAL